jgi:crotonobetainyl-CoA:carnitine CoA-transferase CaiB-like acyl-CoA transferase
MLSNLNLNPRFPTNYVTRRTGARSVNDVALQPFTLSRTPSTMAARPPEFGEQTEEVLAEFGFSAEEIGALRRDKVV